MYGGTSGGGGGGGGKDMMEVRNIQRIFYPLSFSNDTKNIH